MATFCRHVTVVTKTPSMILTAKFNAVSLAQVPSVDCSVHEMCGVICFYVLLAVMYNICVIKPVET